MTIPPSPGRKPGFVLLPDCTERCPNWGRGLADKSGDSGRGLESPMRDAGMDSKGMARRMAEFDREAVAQAVAAELAGRGG